MNELHSVDHLLNIFKTELSITGNIRVLCKQALSSSHNNSQLTLQSCADNVVHHNTIS